MAHCWDVVVVGAGPAGLSAARVVGAAGLSCLCIDRLGPGGELINLGVLHDCPDLPAGTTGPDRAAELADAATEAGVEIAFGEVRTLRRADTWLVGTDDETHAARVVIVATGLAPGRLGVPEEAAFEGRGLSHCASCDGPLYRGEAVIVAGAGRWAVQDAIDLADIAGHVTLLAPDDAPPPAAGLADIACLTGRIVGLEGADGLEAVVIAHGGARERRTARAVFVLTGRRPSLAFAGDALVLDEAGRAIVNADLRTGDAGAYAIGDARRGAPEQLSAAVADGARAGADIVRRLGGTGGQLEGAE